MAEEFKLMDEIISLGNRIYFHSRPSTRRELILVGQQVFNSLAIMFNVKEDSDHG